MLRITYSIAACNGRTGVIREDIDAAARLVLPHRVRRQPLQEMVVDIGEVARQSLVN